MRRVLRLGNGDGDANLQVSVDPGWCFIRYMQSSGGPLTVRGFTYKPEAVFVIRGGGHDQYDMYRMAP